MEQTCHVRMLLLSLHPVDVVNTGRRFDSKYRVACHCHNILTYCVSNWGYLWVLPGAVTRRAYVLKCESPSQPWTVERSQGLMDFCTTCFLRCFFISLHVLKFSRLVLFLQVLLEQKIWLVPFTSYAV